MNAPMDLRSRPALFASARACGKVILVGEHAVVHGQPALAAGLAGALELTATRTADANAPVRVTIPAWDLDVELRGDLEHPVARACSEVLAHCDGPLTGWHVTGTATIPARAGLGSSAALTVALARLVLGEQADRDEVIAASMVGERVFHGEPSGVDSAVAATGGVLRFVRGQAPEPIRVAAPLQLVVVPSEVPRSTADQVARVRRNVERWPTIARPMLDAIGAATDAFQDLLARGAHERMGELMDFAHHLLAALGVSSPILDELCHLARASGAAGAKLTGAGGGGCIIALPASDPAPVLAAFRARGLAPIVVEVQPC